MPMTIRTQPFGLLLLGRLNHPRWALLASRPCREPMGMVDYKPWTHTATVLALIPMPGLQDESLLIAMSPGPCRHHDRTCIMRKHLPAEDGAVLGWLVPQQQPLVPRQRHI